MHNLTWNETTFLQDGQPVNMVSGEFHYFRVPRADWRKRLQLLKQAGGTTIATYIPWLIHEPVEGSFTFGGHDYDELDEFLTICAEEGVQVVARPGPYQYSELRYSGLPEWLCLNYPELLAKNLEGETFNIASISYMHPLFLQKAKAWFDAVCPILKRHTASRGGAIVAAQVDNEAMGVHMWSNGRWYDYNPDTFGFGREDGRWPQFLRRKYGAVEALSRAWESDVPSFAEAMPICRAPDTLGEARRVRDYERCYFEQVADYFVLLADWMRERGLDVPFVHNSPNPETNANYYEAVDKMGPDFLLGSDHYYTLDQTWPQNNPTPQYAIRNFMSLELLRNMGYPPTVFEMPSGSLSDWPPVVASDVKTAYLANAALGMQGWNYYIWTGGPNVPNTGSTTDIYDYGAPVGAFGEVRPMYYAQKAFHEKWSESGLAGSTLMTDLTVGYDREMPRAWCYAGLLGRGESVQRRSGGAGMDGPEVAWEATRQGLISTCLCAGVTPEMCDLERRMPDPAKPLALITSRVMARAAQEKLVQFLKAGGKLLFGPLVPMLDEELNPCTLLSDALGGLPQPVNANAHGMAIMDMAAVTNIMNNGALYASDLPKGAEKLAWDRNTGAALAYKMPAAGGTVVWLGLRWMQAKREHEAMLRALLAELGMTQPVVTHSNPNPFAVVRQGQAGPVCIVMNLYSSAMETDVTVCLDGKKSELGPMTLAPMEVKILPVAR